MKEMYQEWNPSNDSTALLEDINLILEDFEQQGYILTLRQLYYQLVSRGVIPNTVASYGRIGNVVNRGRLAGLIDWDMIEDRMRIPQSRTHWSSPREIIEAAASSYYRARWDDQDYYIEVWCEKDAVSNIIQPVCRRWDVTFMANRGYSSQSAMYAASRRLESAYSNGKSLEVVYLGDHDPSGIDMTRDITDRLGIFLNDGEPVSFVHRLALNMDQVKRYRPPENPAKVTDSRFQGYMTRFGNKSWELDALEPKVLAQLVEDRITIFVDQDLWDEVEDREEKQQKELLEMAKLVNGED